MIKFFRKIRQNMLTENKFGKYLTYAIGEIVLVVIGILIALSINNWNESHKLDIEENRLLNSLKEDFTQNSARIDEIIKKQNGVIENSKSLIKIMNYDGNSINSDSLILMIRKGAYSWWKEEIILDTYDAVLSSGKINILKNADIKRLLAGLSAESNSGFEDHNESMLTLNELNKQTSFYYNDFLVDSELKEFGLTRNQNSVKASIDKFLSNKEILGLIIRKTSLEKDRLSYQNRLKKYINEILQNIELQLKK